MEPFFSPRKGVVSCKKYKCGTAADLGVYEQVLGYINSKKQTRVNLSTNTLLDTVITKTLTKEDI